RSHGVRQPGSHELEQTRTAADRRLTFGRATRVSRLRSQRPLPRRNLDRPTRVTRKKTESRYTRASHAEISTGRMSCVVCNLRTTCDIGFGLGKSARLPGIS
ncbi:unnamed protein product, partial [Mycena citricolor]